MTFRAAGDTIEMENGRGTKGDAVVRRGRTETRPAACATRLEAEALAVEIGIYAEMSKQCRELPESDPLCTAYQDARDAATLAHTAIQKFLGRACCGQGRNLRADAGRLEPRKRVRRTRETQGTGRLRP